MVQLTCCEQGFRFSPLPRNELILLLTRRSHKTCCGDANGCLACRWMRPTKQWARLFRLLKNLLASLFKMEHCLQSKLRKQYRSCSWQSYGLWFSVFWKFPGDVWVILGCIHSWQKDHHQQVHALVQFTKWIYKSYNYKHLPSNSTSEFFFANGCK